MQQHAARWWTYQRERFPLISHGLLIAAFSFAVLSYTAGVRDAPLPPLPVLLAAWASALLFFLQLRIADEFKDYAEDCRYRPYRAVPRGLVTLRELGVLAIGTMAVQLALALAISVRLLPLLLLVWAYLGLMSVEFFAPAWLRRHFGVYVLSHLLIVPLIDLYVSGFEWAVRGAALPVETVWLLVVSYANGLVFEVGRKLRAPEAEEPGVETYSARLGGKKAVAVWRSAVLFAAAAAVITAWRAGFALALLGLLVALLPIALLVSALFLRQPVQPRAERIEAVSGIWMLVLYLGLGVFALL